MINLEEIKRRAEAAIIAYESPSFRDHAKEAERIQLMCDLEENARTDIPLLVAEVEKFSGHISDLVTRVHEITAERDKLKSCLERAMGALRTLRNETKGTLSAHELAIRYDAGNSNWNCLEMALQSADEAIAAIEKEMKG